LPSTLPAFPHHFLVHLPFTLTSMLRRLHVRLPSTPFPYPTPPSCSLTSHPYFHPTPSSCSLAVYLFHYHVPFSQSPLAVLTRPWKQHIFSESLLPKYQNALFYSTECRNVHVLRPENLMPYFLTVPFLLHSLPSSHLFASGFLR
jgi:hypothetical protein